MKKTILALFLMLCSTATWAGKPYYNRTDTGYKGFMDVSFNSAFHETKNREILMGIKTSHGYQFNNYFFLGAGVGISLDNIRNSKGTVTNNTYIPFFGQARVNLLNRRISPYVDFKGGYAFDDLEGGFIEPSVGVSFAIAYKFAINVGLDFTRNYVRKPEVKGDDHVNHLSINLGFEF